MAYCVGYQCMGTAALIETMRIWLVMWPVLRCPRCISRTTAAPMHDRHRNSSIRCMSHVVPSHSMPIWQSLEHVAEPRCVAPMPPVTGMRELWATGWMQQSVRMVCAAFLTEYLNIPWQVSRAGCRAECGAVRRVVYMAVARLRPWCARGVAHARPLQMTFSAL